MALDEAKLLQIKNTYTRLQSWRTVAHELGLPRSTVRWYQKALKAALLPLTEGNLVGTKAKTERLPKRGQVKRYILTCAQNNTCIHGAAWANLKALAEHYHAQLMVSHFAYNATAYQQ